VPIVDPAGLTIGEHDGALFYTIGQRHGLDVGGGLPYYVVGKDMAKNEVYVTTDLQDSRLWSKALRLTSLHWINQPPLAGQSYQVRTRYRAPLIGCRVNEVAAASDRLDVSLDDGRPSYYARPIGRHLRRSTRRRRRHRHLTLPGAWNNAGTDYQQRCYSKII